MSQELEKIREAINREYDNRCPHARSISAYDAKRDKYWDGPNLCEINDKLCLLESGDSCYIWDDIKIDRIVVEMPKAENPNNLGINEYSSGLYYGWERCLEAQCRHLAEQGYRKVPDRERIIILLVARDEELTVEDAKIHWDKWVAALNEEPWANSKHAGDCTNEPQTCIRCLVESYYRDADLIIEKLLEGDNE